MNRFQVFSGYGEDSFLTKPFFRASFDSLYDAQNYLNYSLEHEEFDWNHVVDSLDNSVVYSCFNS